MNRFVINLVARISERLVAGSATALGIALIVVGSMAMDVGSQTPGGGCSGDYSGPMCTETRVCLVVLCWDFYTYWPGEGDEISGGNGLPEHCDPCWDMTWCETPENQCYE